MLPTQVAWGRSVQTPATFPRQGATYGYLPSLLGARPCASAVSRAGASTCTVLFRLANTFKATMYLITPGGKPGLAGFPHFVGNWGPEEFV